MTLKLSINRYREFTRGIGQLIDFNGVYTAEIEEKYLNTNSDELDAMAIKSGWVAVGKDIKAAMVQNDGAQK